MYGFYSHRKWPNNYICNYCTFRIPTNCKLWRSPLIFWTQDDSRLDNTHDQLVCHAQKAINRCCATFVRDYLNRSPPIYRPTIYRLPIYRPTMYRPSDKSTDDISTDDISTNLLAEFLHYWPLQLISHDFFTFFNYFYDFTIILGLFDLT
jgi:hypothetical protein